MKGSSQPLAPSGMTKEQFQTELRTILDRCRRLGFNSLDNTVLHQGFEPSYLQGLERRMVRPVWTTICRMHDLLKAAETMQRQSAFES